MICSRHIALAMVTLYGIAVSAIIIRSYRRKAANKHTIHQLAPGDIISRLPDEILISILSLMPTRDAIRTSILSNRWRNHYKSAPYIDFQCDRLFGLRRPPHPHDSNLIVNSVDRYLMLRSGHKINYFYFRCCLSKSDTDQFEKCICCLGKSGVEELFLGFSCYPRSRDRCDVSFSFHLLSKMPSLKYFTLMCCTLNPNLKTQCKFLQRLSLSFVKLLPGALECILSNCSSLQSLGMSLVEFQYPCYKLCFRGPNLQLKSLKMQFCKYFEEIEFYASNLLVFELQGPLVSKFIFDHVPHLETIHLSFLDENIISYVFEKLARDLPHLKSLMFANVGEFYQLSNRLVGIHETFKNLRRLGLTLNVTPIDLLSLIPLLHGCPLLEEFNLATRFEDRYDGPKLEYNIVLPSELKKVEMSGFGGTENEIEFALYIMRNAIDLEQMHVIRRDKFYMGFGSWMERDQTPWDEETCKLIEDQLKGQAVNKKAQLIVEHASLDDDM